MKIIIALALLFAIVTVATSKCCRPAGCKPGMMCPAVCAPCTKPEALRKYKGGSLSDKEINFEDILNIVKKGKEIYDILNKKKGDAAETESDIYIRKGLNKIARETVKVGKAYGRSKGLPLADSFKSGSVAASFAASQVGKGYSQQTRLGSSSFDCSGLVNRAWASAGKKVPMTTSGYPSSGLPKATGAMQPGDILYRPGHVGMYVGNGKVVNAENPRSGVQQRDIGWYSRNMGYTTVFRP